jgi:transposase
MAKYNQKVETVLVAALAKGATVAQAARQAGVSERTVYRRRQQPDFQARIDALQNDILQRVATLLTKATEEGIRSLVSLQEQSTPASVRRAAARDILEVGIRLREAADLEKRVLALENGVVEETPSGSPAVAPPAAGHGKRRRGDKLLQAALAGGDSIAQAAAKAKLSERTVYRRLQDGAFQRGVDALRADMVQRASALLVAAALLATKTLIDLQDTSIPASVRRGASRDILELGRKLRESVFLEKRLAALEQQLGESPTPPQSPSWPQAG